MDFGVPSPPLPYPPWDFADRGETWPDTAWACAGRIRSDATPSQANHEYARGQRIQRTRMTCLGADVIRCTRSTTWRDVHPTGLFKFNSPLDTSMGSEKRTRF